MGLWHSMLGRGIRHVGCGVLVSRLICLKLYSGGGFYNAFFSQVFLF